MIPCSEASFQFCLCENKIFVLIMKHQIPFKSFLNCCSLKMTTSNHELGIFFSFGALKNKLKLKIFFESQRAKNRWGQFFAVKGNEKKFKLCLQLKILKINSWYKTMGIIKCLEFRKLSLDGQIF